SEYGRSSCGGSRKRAAGHGRADLQYGFCTPRRNCLSIDAENCSPLWLRSKFLSGRTRRGVRASPRLRSSNHHSATVEPAEQLQFCLRSPERTALAAQPADRSKRALSVTADAERLLFLRSAIKLPDSIGGFLEFDGTARVDAESDSGGRLCRQRGTALVRESKRQSGGPGPNLHGLDVL